MRSPMTSSLRSALALFIAALTIAVSALALGAEDSPLVKAAKAGGQKRKSMTKVITNEDLKKPTGNLTVSPAETPQQEPRRDPLQQQEEQPRAANGYAPYPQPDHGYVTDIAHVLTPQQEERLEQWLIRTEEGTKTEVVVVTIRSMQDYPGSSNSSIEEFAKGLFNKWRIGNVAANDGILLLVSVEDRNARIELGAGYPASRNADANRIMQNTIVPEFRKGEYAAGIEKGVKAIVVEFTGYRIGVNWPLIASPILILIGVVVAISLFRSGRNGWGWVVIGLILVLLLVLLRALREVNRFGKSSGWSAGGLGGFGGGFSSGGGATGSW